MERLEAVADKAGMAQDDWEKCWQETKKMIGKVSLFVGGNLIYL